MELKEYLFRNRITITEFAKRIRYNRTWISSIVSGADMPSRRLAETIEAATEGQVTVDELLRKTF